MPRDPSLLPEDMRRKEEDEAAANARAAAPAVGGMGEFHIPGAVVPSAAPPPAPAAVTPPPPPPAAVTSPPRPLASVPAPLASTPPAPTPARNGNGRRNGKPRGANGGAKRDASAFSTPPPMRGKAFRGITLMPGALRNAAAASAWIPGTAVAGIVLALLLIGVPWFMLEQRIPEARATVDALEARKRDAAARAATAEQDLVSYRRTIARAGALRELLAVHRSWAPFFQLFESRTLPSVRYDGLTVDVTGSVMLPVTAPSVRAAAEQIRAWQEAAGVSNVEVSGIASSTDELGVVRGARFDVQFQVDPNTFTSTDDAQGIGIE